jgi:hypothetical protein
MNKKLIIFAAAGWIAAAISSWELYRLALDFKKQEDYLKVGDELIRKQAEALKACHPFVTEVVFQDIISRLED